MRYGTLGRCPTGPCGCGGRPRPESWRSRSPTGEDLQRHDRHPPRSGRVRAAGCGSSGAWRTNGASLTRKAVAPCGPAWAVRRGGELTKETLSRGLGAASMERVDGSTDRSSSRGGVIASLGALSCLTGNHDFCAPEGWTGDGRPMEATRTPNKEAPDGPLTPFNCTRRRNGRVVPPSVADVPRGRSHR